MLTVAVAQTLTDPADFSTTVARHSDIVTASEADLVVFPECSLTGYDSAFPGISAHESALDPLIHACAETETTALVGAIVASGGVRLISLLEVDGSGSRLAYSKMNLGGSEPDHFAEGAGPSTIEVKGWRIGLGICKDTRIDEHLDATASLGMDLYAAGLIHTPDELGEFDERATHIARTYNVAVAFAGFAGATGAGYETTSGGSGIWDRTGSLLAQADARPGSFVKATLTR